MHRAVVMLALLLALGLSTSLLVAWAGALVDRSAWPDTPLTGEPVGSRTEMRGWLVEAGRDRTLSWRTFNALDLWDEPPDFDTPTNLPAWSVGHALPDQPGPFAPARQRTLDEAWEVSAGWPMRCVRAVRTAGPTEYALPGELVRGGFAAMAVDWPAATGAVEGADQIRFDPWPVGPFAAIVPLRPMPIGLFVNTLVLAALWSILLLPLCALRPLRRRRRRKRGRCVRCGHDRDGLPDGAPCSECGHDPAARSTVLELLAARAPALGAALALVLVAGASAVLLTHRWMAVDPLPPLHRAAAVGDAQQIERVLAGGAAIHEALGERAGVPGFLDHSTPLHWAAARGHAAAVNALLDAGADPAMQSFGYPPMVVALFHRHEPVVEAMLPHLGRFDTPSGLETAFCHASDAMRARLLAHFEWEDWRLQNAACSAIMGCDPACVELLVASGLDHVGDHPRNVLRHAVSTDRPAWDAPYRRDLGSTAHVLGLGLKGTETAAIRAFDQAMLSGCLPAFDAMLAAYPMRRYRVQICSPRDLAAAAVGGGEPMVRRLVELGASTNVGGRDVGNALWYAAMQAEPDAVAVLLDAGVDPTHEADGRTVRRWLLETAQQAASDPDANRWAASITGHDGFGRLVEMLEAAEAAWHAREREPTEPGGR